MALHALGPLARPFVTRRELRVAVMGTTLVALALAASLVLPLWQLALGPILWGVLHVLADVRYLVVRPGLHRRGLTLLAVGIPLAAVPIYGHAWIGFVAVAIAVVAARTSVRRRIVGASIAGVLGLAAWSYGHRADLLFGHAHNYVAVVLWWMWRRRAGGLHWVVLAAMLLGTAVILGGVGDPLLRTAGSLQWAPSGLGLRHHLATLAPGFEPTTAVRLVVLFCFAQSVHYIVWLRLVPEDDRPRETPRTYRATLHVLEGELGRTALWLVLVATAGVVLWAVADLAAARGGYLRATLFHGHMELAAAALLLAEGNRWFVSGSKRSS